MLSLIGIAVYQWGFTDSAFIPLAFWLITPFCVSTIRFLFGSEMRVLRSIKREGGYVVSADIERGENGIAVSLYNIDGDYEKLKSPFIYYTAEYSCKAILLHSLSDNSELNVVAFGKAVTPELFDKFQKPYFIKPGTVVNINTLSEI